MNDTVVDAPEESNSIVSESGVTPQVDDPVNLNGTAMFAQENAVDESENDGSIIANASDNAHGFDSGVTPQVNDPVNLNGAENFAGKNADLVNGNGDSFNGNAHVVCHVVDAVNIDNEMEGKNSFIK